MGGFFCQQARDDESPIGEVGLAERLIVREVRHHQQLDLAWTAGDQIVSHPDGKETVFFAVEDEDGDRAIPQGFHCGPDRRHEGGERSRDSSDAGRVSKRREGRAEDEVVSPDAVRNSGSRTTAEGKAEDRNGKRRGEMLELSEGGLSVQFALDPIDAAGTQAIPRVVKNQRGDAVRGQELLDGEPAANGFANPVADENCCARRACGWLDKNCVYRILPARDGMPENRLVGERATWADAEQIERPVSPYQESHDAG